MLGDGIAALVELDVVDKGRDRFAGETALLHALEEDAAAFFTPAELSQDDIVGPRRKRMN